MALIVDPTGQLVTARVPAWFTTLTVANTAVGITLSAPADLLLVQVQAQPIRVRNDGNDPTTTVGLRFDANQFFELVGGETFGAFRAIREGGTSATLAIQAYLLPVEFLGERALIAHGRFGLD